MAERQDDTSGMGSVPRGPSFVPWSPVKQPPQQLPPADPYQPYLGPRRSRWPVIISVLAIVLVAAVVAGASLVAHWNDTHLAAPPPAEAHPSSVTTTPTDRIDFISDEGTGQLIMRARSWVRDGQPIFGTYLRVEVELVCTSGEVDYDPYNFQAFDRSGQLFEMATEGTAGRPLAVGTLRAGQRIRGTIAFDMPRGDVTLLMSDDSEKTVTALKVPD